ncbi:E3 ubiquitin-protein ligase APD1 isoform X2 [Jatropha curcas]|nr:E3 ubiquitin-protein ligase APD1 isoform X2 [Jatropha curcas]
MVLGPSSSRLMKASSVFVEQVEVRDEDKKGVLLYGFFEKPELSLETNWSTSDYIIVASYSRKGFSLWLNRGSRIRMRWETQTSILNQLQVVLVKGERTYETLLPKVTTTLDVFNLSQSLRGKEVEYIIEEDDKYYLGLVNTNRKSIIMKLSLNVTSKLYDISKAKNMCSTINGSCRLKLLFPNIHYVVVTTPDNDDTGGWYVELSFVARVITYIAILGFIIVIIFLVLKYLGACDSETTLVETAPSYQVSESETEPILPQKSVPFTYGTNVEEDEEDRSSSSSSEDLYDAKLCVICYDEQRNCFFVPCGHCATCYDCAQRIMEGENKICPICRRLINKVRRLFTP